MPQLLNMKLGDALVTAGLLTDDQLHDALEKQKSDYRRLGQILLEDNLVHEDDLAEAHAIQMEMPYVQLSDINIPRDVIKLIPEPVARTYNVVPVSVAKDRIAVAMENPMDVEALDAIQRFGKRKVQPLLASAGRIRQTIESVYGIGAPPGMTTSLGEAMNSFKLQRVDEIDGHDLNEEMQQSQQAPVVQTVDLLLLEALKLRASDIHIEPRARSVEIRYRVDGDLRIASNLPKQMQAAIISRIKIMADMDISEKRTPQDGRVKMSYANKTIDLRVSTLPVQYGERITIRVLDKGLLAFSLDSLGFADRELMRFRKLIGKPYGILLVTGPTGSGKTTTLYSALSHIRSDESNIMTCEDPIEYELEGINQSAVNPKAGLTFASQLRAILRQDPDIILLGEIRDLETAETAFQAAMTGHLVLSTLHCNDAPGAITRLLDMKIEPYLIDSSVIGVVAQRLVKRLCPKCKTAYKPSRAELALFNLQDREGQMQFYKARGCSACHGGYLGRTPLIELMVINEEIRRLIPHRPTSDKIREIAAKKGMRTMLMHAMEKVIQGVTTVEEVRRKVFVEEDKE